MQDYLIIKTEMNNLSYIKITLHVLVDLMDSVLSIT